MGLQTSGAISLNEIHIEAGGTSGTLASINDSDIRALIGKSSGAQMSFNEWYGAAATCLQKGTAMSRLCTSCARGAAGSNTPPRLASPSTSHHRRRHPCSRQTCLCRRPSRHRCLPLHRCCCPHSGTSTLTTASAERHPAPSPGQVIPLTAPPLSKLAPPCVQKLAAAEALHTARAKAVAGLTAALLMQWFRRRPRLSSSHATQCPSWKHLRLHYQKKFQVRHQTLF